MGLLDPKQIRARAVGRAVLSEISITRPKTVTIRPYVPSDPDDYNAGEHDDDGPAATATGMPILNSKGIATGGGGTGKGSNALVDFTPDMWGVFSSGRSSTSQPTGPASDPDDVLLHELVHACRDVRGMSYMMAVSGNYDNEEEYLAIVIVNVYLSEKGKTDLRANHKGHTVLKDPDKFLDLKTVDLKPRVLIERLRQIHGTLYDSLSRIGPPVKFNPFFQYEQQRPKP
jgi:hypothetical protein